MLAVRVSNVPMLSEIKTLLIVQDRDTRLRRVKEELQRLPEEAARSTSIKVSNPVVF